MSWDVMLLRVPETIRTFDDLTEHPDPNPLLPLGTRDEFQANVSAVFPGTDWSDPSWGIWQGEEGSIEFNVGADEQARSAMLHVRASPAIVARIIALIEPQGWKAIDISAGDFLTTPDDTAGLEGWRSYRDAVIGDDSTSTDPPSRSAVPRRANSIRPSTPTIAITSATTTGCQVTFIASGKSVRLPSPSRPCHRQAHASRAHN